ncbi:hypothetical protein P7K49_008522, partial [Saguinus oedipus]
MAKVQVNNVVVLDNPSPFYNPFQFEITFECIEDLSEAEARAAFRRSPGVCRAQLARNLFELKSGGSHVVSFVCERVARRPALAPAAPPEVARGWLHDRPPRPSRPGHGGWEGRGCACSGAGEFGAEPSYSESRIGPVTPAHGAFSCPAARLPSSPRRKAAHSGVASLSGLAMPGRFREESEAVLALISGSLDQPAGEAGAGSAPPRRGLGAGVPRGPRVLFGRSSSAGARDAPGCAGMLARRLPNQRGLLSPNDEKLISGREIRAELG